MRSGSELSGLVGSLFLFGRCNNENSSSTSKNGENLNKYYNNDLNIGERVARRRDFWTWLFTGQGILVALILLGLFVPYSKITIISIDISDNYEINTNIEDIELIPILPYLLRQNVKVIPLSEKRLSDKYEFFVNYLDNGQYGDIYYDVLNFRTFEIEVRTQSTEALEIELIFDKKPKYNEVLYLNDTKR